MILSREEPTNYLEEWLKTRNPERRDIAWSAKYGRLTHNVVIDYRQYNEDRKKHPELYYWIAYTFFNANEVYYDDKISCWLDQKEKPISAEYVELMVKDWLLWQNLPIDNNLISNVMLVLKTIAWGSFKRYIKDEDEFFEQLEAEPAEPKAN